MKTSMKNILEEAMVMNNILPDPEEQQLWFVESESDFNLELITSIMEETHDNVLESENLDFSEFSISVNEYTDIEHITLTEEATDLAGECYSPHSTRGEYIENEMEEEEKGKCFFV